jgi:molecular chaperone GrpE (heat shock protein)
VGQAPSEDPLDNRPWVQLVEECVGLFDELDRLRPDLDVACQDFADHVGCRLQEILERSGVTRIAGDPDFDRSRHQPHATGATRPGAPVAETLSPGFAVGRRVFRRAVVRIADAAPTEKGSTP